MNIKKIISTIAVIGCLSACMIPAVSYADEIQYEPEISMLANKGNIQSNMSSQVMNLIIAQQKKTIIFL